MLRALSVATQGLAPFPLSALALAVHGLIAELQSRRGEVSLSNDYYHRKVYVRRGKKLHIFDSVEEADEWLEAEAKEVKPTRKAKKKLQTKAFQTAQTIDLPNLVTLAEKFDLPVVPAIAAQDWARVLELFRLAKEQQDEDDIELLLLSI